MLRRLTDETSETLYRNITLNADIPDATFNIDPHPGDEFTTPPG